MEEAPPYKRANFAYINIPGPFEKGLAVDLLHRAARSEWTAEERAAYIPGEADLLFISVHEVWPGHFLQFLHANRIPRRFGRVFVGLRVRRGLGALRGRDDVGSGPRQRRSRRAHRPAHQCAAAQRALTCRAIGLHTQGMTVERVASSCSASRLARIRATRGSRRRAARSTRLPQLHAGQADDPQAARGLAGEAGPARRCAPQRGRRSTTSSFPTAARRSRWCARKCWAPTARCFDERGPHALHAPVFALVRRHRRACAGAEAHDHARRRVAHEARRPACREPGWHRGSSFPVSEPAYDDKEVWRDLWLVLRRRAASRRAVSRTYEARRERHRVGPDGRRIACSRPGREDDEQDQIYILDVDGGEAQRVTKVEPVRVAEVAARRQGDPVRERSVSRRIGRGDRSARRRSRPASTRRASRSSPIRFWDRLARDAPGAVRPDAGRGRHGAQPLRRHAVRAAGRLRGPARRRGRQPRMRSGRPTARASCSARRSIATSGRAPRRHRAVARRCGRRRAEAAHGRQG